MANRFILCICASILVMASTIVVAQSNDVHANQELAEARRLIQESRDAIIREDLRLTADEAAEFWPLYEKYRSDVLPIQDRYVELIADYTQHYESGRLTDRYAEELLDGYFDIKEDLLRTRKKYIRQFKKVLPMLKVARFYQLENKMNADVDAVLALQVPLIESN